MAPPIWIPPFSSRNMAQSIWIPPFSSRNMVPPTWIPPFSSRNMAQRGLPWIVPLPLGNSESQPRIFIHESRLQLLRKSCLFGQLAWGGPFRGATRGQTRAKRRFTTPNSSEKLIRDAKPERKVHSRRQTRTKSGFTTPNPSEKPIHDAKPERYGPAYLNTLVFLE